MGTVITCSGSGLVMAAAGDSDNSARGAVFIFTAATVDGQYYQTAKIAPGLTAAGATSNFGFGMSMSYDGLTLAIGGYSDDSSKGGVWVYTFSVVGGWTQQGSKFVGGTGALLGFSISLSYDGNMMWSGAPGDTSYVGAAYYWTRVNGAWTQVGAKITGGNGRFGAGISVAGDKMSWAIGDTHVDTILGAVYVTVNAIPDSGAWSETETTDDANYTSRTDDYRVRSEARSVGRHQLRWDIPRRRSSEQQRQLWRSHRLQSNCGDYGVYPRDWSLIVEHRDLCHRIRWRWRGH